MSYEWTRIPTASIIIPKEHQRPLDKEHVDNLFYSIQEHSLLQPIVVHRNTNELVFGLHRLAAWKRHEEFDQSGEYKRGIPARYIEDLSATEILVLRLTENVQRKSLSWQEEAEGYLEISRRMRDEDPEWDDANTAGLLKTNAKLVNRAIQVAKAIQGGHSDLAQADSLRAAYSIYTKGIKKKVTRELLTFEKMDLSLTPTPALPVQPGDGPAVEDIESLDLAILGESDLPTETDSLARDTSLDVHHMHFSDFAENFMGEKYNLIHCDFPYGVGLDKSEQKKTFQDKTSYEDAETDFWDCLGVLHQYQDKLLHPVCHMMFWFPMRNYNTIYQFIAQTLEWRVVPYPLIWHKTDDRGIVPDPTREGRRVYETALMASRGDARIIGPVANAVGAPTGRDHTSQKSQDVLAHFFRMFVGEETSLLDPTCGSGTSLAAATRLGAKSVTGLDINLNSVEVARDILTSAKLHRLEERDGG